MAQKDFSSSSPSIIQQLEIDTRSSCPFLNNPSHLTPPPNSSPQELKRSSPQTSWTEIRVFISSTFKDYHCEREILVHTIFPRLKDWCERRNLLLVEVDLRWGVPSQSSTGTTLRACLNEIDRCYEMNGSPFFINMLGNRYGWVPSHTDVPDDVRSTFRWIPNASVTHMEIVHAALRNYNPNALFLIRDSNFINDLPCDLTSDFIESNPQAQNSLEMLKSVVREAYSPTNQIIDYSPQFNGIETLSTNLPKVKLSQMSQFSEAILEFLQKAIERQYPQQNTSISLSNNLKISLFSHQEQFLYQKSRNLFGRDLELGVMLQYLTSPFSLSSSSSLASSEEQQEDRSPNTASSPPSWIFGDLSLNYPILLYSPESSRGKSTLLSCLYLQAMPLLLSPQSSSSPSLFFHSFQALQNDFFLPNGLTLFLFRFCLEFGNISIQNKLMTCLSSHPSFVKIPDEDLLHLFHQVINEQQFSSSLSLPLIVILDEINFPFDSTHGMDIILRLFPTPLPSHLRVIYSTSHITIMESFIHSISHYSHLKNLLYLTPLSSSSLQLIIISYFHIYNKLLDQTQLTLLLSHPSIQNMSWLSLACDTIRLFGAFETINNYILTLPSTGEELLLKYLERIELLSSHLSTDTHRFSLYFQSIIYLLLVSKSGLQELEIRILLNQIKNDSERLLNEGYLEGKGENVDWGEMLAAKYSTYSPSLSSSPPPLPCLEPIPYMEWSVVYSFLKIFLKLSYPFELTAERYYRPYQPRYIIKSNKLRQLLQGYYKITTDTFKLFYNSNKFNENIDLKLKYYSLQLVYYFENIQKKVVNGLREEGGWGREERRDQLEEKVRRGEGEGEGKSEAEGVRMREDLLRLREEYPFQLLSCRLYQQLNEYMYSNDYQHLPFLDQRYIMNTIRCPFLITPSPSSSSHPSFPSSHSSTSPSKEVMCLGCSMKNTKNKTLLNRQCCYLCGKMIHSIYFINGMQCNVQLNPSESFCYQCRTHNPIYYQPVTQTTNRPFPPSHPRPSVAPPPRHFNTLSVPGHVQLQCIYCKMPINNITPALPIIQCHSCSLHVNKCIFTEKRNK